MAGNFNSLMIRLKRSYMEGLFAGVLEFQFLKDTIKTENSVSLAFSLLHFNSLMIRLKQFALW